MHDTHILYTPIKQSTIIKKQPPTKSSILYALTNICLKSTAMVKTQMNSIKLNENNKINPPSKHIYTFS